MRMVLTVILFLSCFFLFAQESHFSKPGTLKPEHFVSSYSIDSDASAIVLYDKGHTVIEGNDKGWFSALFTRRKLLHILDKRGYEYADVEINLYTRGNAEEKLVRLQAATYNVENGKIVKTPLEKKDIFRLRQNKNVQVIKFAMPDVKPGSIIEFEYSLTSDYYWQIDPWYFQEEIPTLWSEYVFSVPQFFSYTFLSKGYQPFFINNKKETQGRFHIADVKRTGSTQWKNFSAGVTDCRWVKKDVPALKEETFTSTIKNHISEIEFTLVAQNHPLEQHDFRLSWKDVTKELLESENFGKNLNSPNNWLNDEVKKLVGGTSSGTGKAKRIFEFVRDRVYCTSHTAIHTETALKNVFKLRRGNVAEINLLLTALLRKAGLKADPVILSRTDYGFTYENYPGLSRFNYVVVKLTIREQNYFLDAAQPVGFGKLPAACYNGHARVVDDSATVVFFRADSLKERKITVVDIKPDKQGKLAGRFYQIPGYYESCSIRSCLKEKGRKECLPELEKRLGMEVSINNEQIDSVDNYDDPVSIKYELQIDPGSDSVFYIDPLFGEGYEKNPFASPERFYPVELPYTIDETFVLNIELPQGYEVAELPRQVLVKHDRKGDSFFEYRTQRIGNTISLRSRLKLARAYYEPEEYEELKQFFNLVVKKHNEQIVLKKQKAN